MHSTWCWSAGLLPSKMLRLCRLGLFPLLSDHISRSDVPCQEGTLCDWQSVFPAFYVPLVLPSDHTRNISALFPFYVKVSSPRALGLHRILPGMEGRIPKAPFVKIRAPASLCLPWLPFPLSAWAVIDVPNARRDAYVLSSLD